MDKDVDTRLDILEGSIQIKLILLIIVTAIYLPRIHQAIYFLQPILN